MSPRAHPDTCFQKLEPHLKNEPPLISLVASMTASISVDFSFCLWRISLMAGRARSSLTDGKKFVTSMLKIVGLLVILLRRMWLLRSSRRIAAWWVSLSLLLEQWSRAGLK